MSFIFVTQTQDMYTQDIISRDYHANLDYLKGVISEISLEVFSVQPNVHSWSINHIIEHILNVEKSTKAIGNRPTEETDRSPSIKINDIKSRALNFEVKVQAPTAVLPTKERSDHQKMLEELEITRIGILKQGNEKGWHQIITIIKHPIFGAMTRLEWLYFNIYHVERHIHQIRQTLHIVQKSTNHLDSK